MPLANQKFTEIRELMKNLMLLEGNLKMVKERNFEDISDYIAIYETDKETYEIRLIKKENKWIVHEIKDLNSGIGQQTYSYAKFSETTPENIDEIKGSRNFKIC